MIYPIVKFGDPVLETPAATVTEFDTPELHKLIEDMFESMYAARGVGLAAPQIGIGSASQSSNLKRRGPEEKLVLINPEILRVGGHAVRRRRMPQHAGLSGERQPRRTE